MRRAGYARSEHSRPGCVVGLELDGRRGRRAEAVAEQRIDDEIAQLRVAYAPAQGRLLDVAELARDGAAAFVLRLAADFDAIDVGELECDARQRSGRFGGEPFPRAARADPVAD